MVGLRTEDLTGKTFYPWYVVCLVVGGVIELLVHDSRITKNLYLLKQFVKLMNQERFNYYDRPSRRRISHR